MVHCRNEDEEANENSYVMFKSAAFSPSITNK